MQVSKEKASEFYAKGLRVGIKLLSEPTYGALYWSKYQELKTGRLAALSLDALINKYYPECPESDFTFHIEGVVRLAD